MFSSCSGGGFSDSGEPNQGTWTDSVIQYCLYYHRRCVSHEQIFLAAGLCKSASGYYVLFVILYSSVRAGCTGCPSVLLEFHTHPPVPGGKCVLAVAK